jgi:hypothetical protein
VEKKRVRVLKGWQGTALQPGDEASLPPALVERLVALGCVEVVAEAVHMAPPMVTKADEGHGLFCRKQRRR